MQQQEKLSKSVYRAISQETFYVELPATTLWNASKRAIVTVTETISFIPYSNTLDPVPIQIMNKESVLKILKLSDHARIPTEGTIGFDLYSAHGYRIPAKGKRNYIMINKFQRIPSNRHQFI